MGCGPGRAPVRAGLGRRRGARRPGADRAAPAAVAARAGRRLVGLVDGASPTPSRCRGTPTVRRPPGSSRSSTSRSRSRRSPSACPGRAASAPRRRRTPCSRRATTASTYRVVAELPELANPAAKAVPVRTVAFAPVRGPPVPARAHRRQRRRTRCRGWPTGVRLPPVLRRVSEFLVSEFALWPGGRVHQAELKAGFAAAPDYYALDTEPGRRTGRDRPGRGWST